MSDEHETADLRRLSTEQSRRELDDLDLLSIEQLVSLMCSDVHRVPIAVEAAEAAIARTVHGVVDRLERGGRLVYVGAGTAGRLGMLDAAEAGPTFNVPQGQVIGVLAGGAGAFDVPIENAEDDRDGGAVGAVAEARRPALWTSWSGSPRADGRRSCWARSLPRTRPARSP